MSQIVLYILMITAIAGIGGTGLGGVISACFRHNSNKTVSLLLSFAGGVMLAVVCFSLIFDALFPDGFEETPQGLVFVVFGIALGYGVVWFLNYVIDKNTNKEVEHIQAVRATKEGVQEHPKTADDLDELIHSDHFVQHEKKDQSLFTAGLIMAAAIGLHNLPEGMVIGAAYVGASLSTVCTDSAMLIAVVIGLHNIPEGMAVAVPLIAGGLSRPKAVLITAASGATTVVGALIGYLLGGLGPVCYALSLSFASGAMLYVIFGELLPESILMWRTKLPALAVLAGILCGMCFIFH